MVSILAEIFREVHKTLRVDASSKRKNIQVGKISVALYLSFSRSLRFKVQFSFVWIFCGIEAQLWISMGWILLHENISDTAGEKQKRFLASFNFVSLYFIVR